MTERDRLEELRALRRDHAVRLFVAIVALPVAFVQLLAPFGAAWAVLGAVAVVAAAVVVLKHAAALELRLRARQLGLDPGIVAASSLEHASRR